MPKNVILYEEEESYGERQHEMLLQSHDMPQHDNQSVGPISVSGFGIGDNLDLIMPLLS